MEYKASSDWKDEKDNLMEAIRAAFSDIDLEMSSGSYFLQQESAEWGGLIDVCEKLNDHVTVHLCCASTSSEVSNALMM